MINDPKAVGPTWGHRAAIRDRTVGTWLDHPPSSPGEINDDLGADAADHLAAEQAGWLTSIFRFTRADGSAVFGPKGRAPARLLALERWVRRVGDPALARVLGWWRPAGRGAADAGFAAPPLPTETWTDRPLAILRPDWTARGSCLAVDHRVAGPDSLVEVAGRGVIWLGPRWTTPLAPADSLAPSWGAATPTFAASGAFADAYEWSFRAGPVRVTRTASLIRGAGLALLLQTEEGATSAVGEARWSLPDGIDAHADPAARVVILGAGPGRPRARLIPLGLPEANYPTERGSLTVEGREVVLRQQAAGPNRCLALLVAWTAKPPRGWRALTVAERSAPCPPGTAFAARVGWAAGQNGLLLYRSLGPSGLRSVLGHQTRARLLIAGFSPTGEVHPWVKATEEPAGGSPILSTS